MDPFTQNRGVMSGKNRTGWSIDRGDVLELVIHSLGAVIVVLVVKLAAGGDPVAGGVAAVLGILSGVAWGHGWADGTFHLLNAVAGSGGDR